MTAMDVGGACVQRVNFKKVKASDKLALCNIFFCRGRKLFLGSDYVFYGLGNAELYHGLGRDLNGFSGLRIASHTRFPVGFYQASQARNHEPAVLFGFLDRALRERFQKRCCGLVVRFQFLRHVADELGLGHACCHLSSLKIEHLRRNMSTFCCTHWVYYISKGLMQAFSPDFMRLFLRPLWKTGINSGDNRHPSLAPVETQDCVALPQRTMPPQ